MGQDIESVIVIGATGNLGPYVLKALLDSKKFKVSILTRGSSTAKFPSGVTVHQSDYSEASLLKALQGQDAVVSSLAGAAIETQKVVIDAAVKAGVKRFLPSEFGSNTANKYANELVPVFRRKVEIIEYLKKKASANPLFRWTAVVTGPFFDRSLATGILGFSIPNSYATIYDNGTRLFTCTTLPTVGLAIVRVLSNLAPTANRYVYIGSFTVSQNDILAALKTATPGKKWTVEKASTKAELVADQERVAKGDRSMIRPMVTAATFSEGTGADFKKDVGLNNDILGLKGESLGEVVKKVVEGKMP